MTISLVSSCNRVGRKKLQADKLKDDPVKKDSSGLLQPVEIRGFASAGRV